MADPMPAPDTESQRKLSDAHPADFRPLDTPDTENEKKQSDALPANADPFDTRDPHWTLESHLKAYLERTAESSIASVKPSVLWQDLSVTGSGAIATYQETVTGTFVGPAEAISGLLTRNKGPEAKKTIIHGFNGLVKDGEMLLVLGRPGSGCTTLLKALAGLTEEYTGWQGTVEYNGVSIDDMRKKFRGEVVYSPEVDNHFPHLTVAQTLDFAAETRTPYTRIAGASRSDYVQNTRNLLAATFGLTAVLQTNVGDDFVRGASGGERKRVSISEMLATRASVGLWDNSTRGLDASTSLEYAQALRVATSTLRTIAVASLFQASNNIVDVFDKVIVLYAGRQVFFGSIPDALEHFHELGFFHPIRQTTADYLTAVTDRNARVVRDGFEETAPRTAEQFVKRWHDSVYYRKLQVELDEHKAQFPSKGPAGIEEFATVLKQSQAPGLSSGSKYTLNIAMQMILLMKRAYQRTWGAKAVLFAGAISSLIMALIGGSTWYNSAPSTAGFFSKGSVMFFNLLINSINAMGEIPLLYAQRPIVARQNTYAMYHPGLESLATMTAEYPIKFLNLVVLNVVLYFMTNLKREAGAFFIFFLITYVSYITMSSVFRTVGAATKSVEEAMGLAGVLVLALVIYCGYIIPIPTMHPWFKWLSYIDPLRYAFEALMANEFHGMQASCADLVPSGRGFENVTFANQVCAVTGSTAGSSFVSGDDYIKASFTYTQSHLWRNFGILIGFWLFFSFTYAVATELQKPAGGQGEFLIFKKGRAPASIQTALEGKHAEDLEGGSEGAQNLTEELEVLRVHTTRNGLAGLAKSKDIFTWQDVCYDVTVKGGIQHRLLDKVHGYVKPGTLTALMGESGAGKTTLLNVLAQRVDTGTVTGYMLVNGSPLDISFQRRSGYAQQQDVHIAEATVREALRFSAVLRQPKETSFEEKYAYVERVISMLEMEDYAEAVIGNPGSGLSVEQRKRTTIGVELVAKPALLLFLDEPTSGLDSQSAWSIVKLLRKLADSGQAILCTIHQPSSLLFEQFDRVLLLRKGGQTVYFGDIGENSKTITEYFETNEAKACAATANPAEYILDVIGAGATARVEEDWHAIWNTSPEYHKLIEEIRNLRGQGVNQVLPLDVDTQDRADTDHPSNQASNKSAPTRFAASWISQYKMVQIRMFQHYWRSPVYIAGKAILNVFAGLFLGFTFYKESNSIAGLQNKLFAIFMSILLCFPLMAQLQPTFISLRKIYEVREKPSKMYHWSTFVLSNVVVEIFFNCIGSTLFFLPWYYAVGFNEHIEDPSNRAGYTWIMLMLFAMYYTTFAQMMAAIAPDETTAGIFTALVGTLMTLFNGVLQPVSQLPHFWKFMYRVSPFNYLIGGILSTGVHGIEVVCRSNEFNVFQPPTGQTCNDYAGSFMKNSPGQILNLNATSNCQYCRYATGDEFLADLELSWDERWRNTGFMFAYISFNLFCLFALFYVAREMKLKKGATKKDSGPAISNIPDSSQVEKKE